MPWHKIQPTMRLGNLMYSVPWHIIQPMGILEQESKKRTRKNQIQKIILATIATAGILSVMAVAPNALQALSMFGFGKKGKYKYAVENSRRRMVSAGLLEYADTGFLRLTPKGKAKLRQLEFCDYKIKKPKRWDKKWRLLIFDIPQEKRSLRNKIRLTLLSLGFVRLQNSVWAYPYDCEDLMTLIKADFKVGKELLYLIVDKIENDGWLLKHFGLR